MFLLLIVSRNGRLIIAHLPWCRRSYGVLGNGDPCFSIVEHCAALKPTVEEMLKNSDGKTIYEYANNKKQLREGIVWRLIDDPSVSFKVKSPKYMIED